MRVTFNITVDLEVGDIFRIGRKTYTTAYKDNDKTWFRLINLTESKMQEMAFDDMEDMFDSNFRNCEISVVIKRDTAIIATRDELKK